MLVQLLPEQVSLYWPVLKVGIEGSLPPEVENTLGFMSNVLEALLKGEMQAWLLQEVSYEPEEKGEIITKGMVMTTIGDDRFVGIRNLILYSVYSFAKWGDHAGWKEAVETLKAFARANECRKIIGYTAVRSLLEFMVREIGVSAIQAVLVIDV